jgi:hypothetical protein
MLDKPIEDISLADVQAFFDDGGKYPERKTIEYKQELHKFKDDRGRVEFAKDVCSLANTSGGHILFGFSEEDGYPTGLPGAHCEDPDDAIRDMRTAIRIATDPRIDVHAVDIQPVASRSQGKYFFIVRIAQSLNAPHAVLRADRDSVREFWNRHTNGKAAMDASEIRQAFVFSESIIERMRAFREKRVRQIHAAERTPVIVGSGAKCILHLLPLTDFRVPNPIGLDKIEANLRHFPPLLRQVISGNKRITLDGYTQYIGGGGSPDEDDSTHAYTLVYQDGGIVEAVITDIVQDGRHGHYLNTTECELMLLRAFCEFPKGLKALRIRPPVWCFVSLIGVRGTEIHHPYARNAPINRDDLFLPEFEMTNLDADFSELARTSCDYLWNAGGYPKSKTFDQNVQRIKADLAG